MRSTFVWLGLAVIAVVGNSGCCGCYRGYGTTYAAPAYPAPAYTTTPPVVFQPPAVVQAPAANYAPAACSQCAPVCGCQ